MSISKLSKQIIEYRSQIACLSLSILLMSCSASSIDAVSADLGKNGSYARLLQLIDQPGPIVFNKHLVAHWQVDRAGLINLKHPKAQAAGLNAGLEKIELYTYTIKHPRHGTFLVDSGISERFINAAENEDVSMIVKAAMNIGALKVVKTTKAIAEEQAGGIKGVFLSHIHMDHIMGISDLPEQTPIYIGPGDAGFSAMMNVFTQGTTDRLLGNKRKLKEWAFQESEQGFAGIIDIFGDGSVWAIHSPGHSPGSTAYLVRSTQGTQLLLGDVTHTRWGWINGVEPGTFSADIAKSAISLDMLVSLSESHPNIKVHPGHQSL